MQAKAGKFLPGLYSLICHLIHMQQESLASVVTVQNWTKNAFWSRCATCDLCLPSTLKARCNIARNIAPKLESCIVCPPLKLLRATLHATVAEVEWASTSAKSHATVSPCVHHLQHCVQLRDAKVAHNVASCVHTLSI